MKHKFLSSAGIFLICCFLQIQLQAQEKKKPNFPPYGIGFANGFTTGSLGEHDFKGYNGQLRLVRVFNSYPPTVIGLEGAYGRLQFKNQVTYADEENNLFAIQNLEAHRYTLGLSAGIMIPFDLFIQSDKIPRGAGIPIILSYNFLEQIDFDDFEENINGHGFKLGFQLPLPISKKILLNFQFEYFKSFFEDTDEIPVFLDATDLSSEGWNISFQVGVPISKAK